MNQISFIPLRSKRLAPGWYLACHKRSPKGTRPSFVHVSHWQGDETKEIVVFQVGNAEPEKPQNWRFYGKALGMDRPAEELTLLPKPQKAIVIPLAVSDPVPRLAC